MRPPIPSPHPQAEPTRRITKRLEWDDEQKCFSIFYASRFTALLRGEWLIARRKFVYMMTLIAFLPLHFLVMLTLYAASRHTVSQVRVFSWGIRDEAAMIVSDIRWEEIKEIISDQGHILILRHSMWKASVHFPLETFFDLEESRRFETIVRRLWQSQGEQWDVIVNDLKSDGQKL